MSIPLKTVGYDRRTDELSIEHRVPTGRSEEIKALAHLTDLDDGIGNYPLDETATVNIGFAIDQKLDSKLYDWFLEPAAALV